MLPPAQTQAADLEAADILAPTAGHEALLAAEEGALAHMNEDHLDAIALYATRLAGAPDGPWRATGIDPLGMDMSAGDLTARVDFPHPVTDGAGLRRVLVEMAGQARSVG